jgi:hypothetical protein
MKPRARRIALLTVAAGCLVVGTLVAVNWQMVGDHVEAWRFQATRETETLRPGCREPEDREMGGWMFQELADASGRIVIFDPELTREDDQGMTTIEILRQRGYRAIEQILPRRAYVITGYPVFFETLLPPQRFQGGATTTLELKASSR